MKTRKRQLRIMRQIDPKEGLGFWVWFTSGDDEPIGRLFFPYDAFQKFVAMAPQFLQSCLFTEATHRWDIVPDKLQVKTEKAV